MTRIKIDPDRVLGTVDPRIFGGFIEHLGRCIYGGVFDEGSALADENGFRRDVLDAAKRLRMPLLRWPGGNFVSGYHWTDGVGPRAGRPRRMNLAWSAEESNTFGTDEFMAYCERLGTEPYLCLNMGTGTLDEALAWVEYCNGTGDTHWANLRREHGHEAPYNVRYWGLGNEMYGDWQLGRLKAEEYVATAQRWAMALRQIDPDLVLVSCGENGWGEWDRIVIDGLVRHVDLHSIHIYTGSADHVRNVLSPHQAERSILACQAMIDRARYVQRGTRDVRVAYDEWNVWYRNHDDQLAEVYNLSDALAVATFLNIFVRNADAVRVANLAQLVNVIAPMVTSGDELLLQTIYHPLRLMAEHTRTVALDVLVEGCDTLDYAEPELAKQWPHRIADLGPFAVLDVAASRDENRGRLTVSVVNRSADAPVEATIELAGATVRGEAVVHVVTGKAPETENSFAEPENVTAVTGREAVAGASVTRTFPALSHTVIELELG